MKKKRLIYAVCLGFASALVCAGVVYADTHNITSVLGGSTGDIFDVKGAMSFDSIRVGRQGTGGVTYFNGSIVNTTTGTGGADNPVTFGDNVRIDGTVYRGATAGTGDTMPFKVNDNMEVAGSLTTGSLSTGALTATSLSGTGIISSTNLASDSVTSAKITDGTIATADLAGSAVTTGKITDGTIATADMADSAVTTAKILDGTIATEDITNNAITESTVSTGGGIGNTTASTTYEAIEGKEITVTTGNSDILIAFSGTFSNVTIGGTTDVSLYIDGGFYGDYTRTGTSNTNGEKFSLAFFGVSSVLAGEHTFQTVWRTSSGTTSTIYSSEFTIVELKK